MGGDNKAGNLERKEALSYLSRLRKTIENRRQKEVKEQTLSGKSQRKRENSETSRNYFQVEISNRLSGGSDKYSVIEEKASEGNKDAIKKDTTSSPSDYNIIDVTGLVPRSVNCSPLSLHTFLTGPDIIKDLPAAPGRKVGRSISFLSQGEYQRMRRPGKHTGRKTSDSVNNFLEQRTRQTNKPCTVKRSLSAVSDRHRPQKE